MIERIKKIFGATKKKKSAPPFKNSLREPESTGDLIRVARVDRGFYQKELAEKVGLSQATICAIEQGKSSRR